MLNRPRIMEDELLFSYICRTADANSIGFRRFVSLYVYCGKREDLSYGMNVPAAKFAASIGADAVKLFLETTLYPLNSMLSTKEQQTHIINVVFRGTEKYPSLITPVQTDIPALKMCPLCAAEEKKDFGFSWYSRSHNIDGVTVCHKHGTVLRKYTGKAGNAMKMREENFEDIPCHDLKTETEIAVYGHDLLYSGIDCEWADIAQEIIALFNNGNLAEKYSNACGRVFEKPMSTRNWRKKINSGGHLGAGFQLRSMFIAFPDISRLRPHCRTDVLLKCLKESEGYAVFHPMKFSIVTMQKGNEPPFVTTPYGFNIGWRSPYSDDVLPEQEKYKDLLARVKNNEYEPVSDFFGMTKSVTVRHQKCSKIYVVNAKRFLEENVNCPCRNRLSLNDIQSENNSEQFTVVEYDSATKNNEIKITCCHCHETFRIGLRAWKKDKYCRVCEKKTVPVRKFLHKDSAVCNGSGFETEIKNLTGNEYELAGAYAGQAKPVLIRHNVCGKTKQYTPCRFAHGERCNCRSTANGEEFVNFVSKYSAGRYSIKPMAGKPDWYIVTDNESNMKKELRKRMILQELLRPTPSNILPLFEKDKSAVLYIIRKSDVIRKHLRDKYKPGDCFRIEDCWELVGPDSKINKDDIRRFLRKRRKKELLKEISHNVFQYMGE